MKNKLPWRERINAISIHPEMATKEDVLRMAAELSAQPGDESRAPAAQPRMEEVCPHYYEATDGVHVVIVGRCNCKGRKLVAPKEG